MSGGVIMEFSEFELSLLLILVIEKCMDLKMDIMNLSLDKDYICQDEFNSRNYDLKSSFEATDELRKKIQKILEE